MSCKKVEAYKAEDGSLHPTKKKCQETNTRIKLEALFSKYRSYNYPIWMVTSRIMENKDEVKEILNSECD